jgi:hypothetical protein
MSVVLKPCRTFLVNPQPTGKEVFHKNSAGTIIPTLYLEI